MKGFPKRIATEKDLHHCLSMVQNGELEAVDLAGAIDAIEQREYVALPILEISEDRKTVVVAECNLLESGVKVKNSTNTSISAVDELPDSGETLSAIEGGEPLAKGAKILSDGTEEPADQDSAMQEAKRVSVSLTRAISEGEQVLRVLSPVSPYETMGTTKEQVMAIKEVLKAL